MRATDENLTIPAVAHVFDSMEADSAGIPIYTVGEATPANDHVDLEARHKLWLEQAMFTPAARKQALLPGANGDIAGVVLGIGNGQAGDPCGPSELLAGQLAQSLHPGSYRFADAMGAPELAAVAWGLGAYRYRRYKSKAADAPPRLVLPAGIDARRVAALVEAVWFGRNLINTPASDLGPEEIESAARALAGRHGAEVTAVVGDDLLAQNFPMIHAVGRASSRAPRLIDITWGPEGATPVTLVGKGIAFDTGGLDLKPSSAMLLMKKDMGGAACVLALADLLMRSKAPIRLRVLVPAVENAVDGCAYRPGDVLRSRKGLTVEVGNTDAEGRLVLADALAEADAGDADLLIDLATLTGAARTALGPELPAAYSNDAALLAELQRHADEEHDPVWPMPLWGGYDEDLASKIADLNNVASHAFAGSIIGALFLRRFVTASPRWIHIDLYAWNARERPGRPVGAEAQCVRALYRLIRTRCG